MLVATILVLLAHDNAMQSLNCAVLDPEKRVCMKMFAVKGVVSTQMRDVFVSPKTLS